VKIVSLCVGVWAAVCEHVTAITVIVTVYVCCSKNLKYVTVKFLLAKTANPLSQ